MILGSRSVAYLWIYTLHDVIIIISIELRIYLLEFAPAVFSVIDLLTGITTYSTQHVCMYHQMRVLFEFLNDSSTSASCKASKSKIQAWNLIQLEKNTYFEVLNKNNMKYTGIVFCYLKNKNGETIENIYYSI